MSNTIQILPSGLSKTQIEKIKFTEFQAIKQVGRKFNVGDTLLIPDDQVLYYHEIGWLNLTIDQAKYYLAKQRDLDDEAVLDTETPLSISDTTLTVAQAKKEIVSEMSGKMVHVDDVQKMIDSAVSQAIEKMQTKK